MALSALKRKDRSTAFLSHLVGVPGVAGFFGDPDFALIEKFEGRLDGIALPHRLLWRKGFARLPCRFDRALQIVVHGCGCSG